MSVQCHCGSWDHEPRHHRTTDDTRPLHETHVCRDCGAEITLPYVIPHAERARHAALVALIQEGLDAFHFTREYVGLELLPALPGWSWFDWCEKARTALDVNDSIVERVIRDRREALGKLADAQEANAIMREAAVAERARHAALVATVEKRHAEAVDRAREYDAIGHQHGADIWTARYIECAALLRALDGEPHGG